MTHGEKLSWMALWCATQSVTLVLDGHCGIGRECVGISANDNYPEYEWHDEEWNRADNNGEVWTPEDAYHKHPCVAVLGRGEEAEAQLYDWLKWFDDNGFVVTKETNPDALSDPSMAMINAMMGKQHVVRMERKAPDA